jgi:hypothetical protein
MLTRGGFPWTSDEQPGADRDDIRGYFDRAGMLEWYDRLIATL